MQTHLLAAHPDHPPAADTQVEARIIGQDANWLRARWRVEGAQQLDVPAFPGQGRTDAPRRDTSPAGLAASARPT